MPSARWKLIEERLSSTVREMRDKAAISYEDLAERLHLSRSAIFNLAGSRRTIGRKSRSVTHPRLDVLLRLCTHSGVSADWLLGFDVPKARESRAQIGALAAALHDELLRRMPRAAWPEEVTRFRQNRNLGLDDPELAIDVVEVWWQARLREVAVRYEGAINGLVASLRQEASNAATLQRRGCFLAAAEHCADAARSLASGPLSWEQIAGLRTGPLQIDPAITDEPEKILRVKSWQSTFPAAAGEAGLGLYIRSERRDMLWFLEPETLQPAFRTGDNLVVPVIRTGETA